VGVQRQYSGTMGKIANCQVAASLTIATRTEHVPVDFALYLPESWNRGSIRGGPRPTSPMRLTFKTKPELGVEMIERAIADGLPAGLVLADSAYGDNSEFRRRVRCEGLGYAVGLHRTTTVWRVDSLGRRIGDPVAVGDLADAIGRGGFRRVTWREGTKGKMSSRFATERVVLAQDDLVDPSQREAVWLLMEWPHGEKAATDFYRDHVAGEHVTAPARPESQAAVAHRTGVRGRQGRAWAGPLRGPLLPRLEPSCVHGAGLLRVHRLPSVSRAFPPSAGKTATRKASHRHDGADGSTSGATLPGFLHHRAPGRRACPGHMATPMPSVSQTAIDGPPGAHAREHRRTTPFLNQ